MNNITEALHALNAHINDFKSKYYHIPKTAAEHGWNNHEEKNYYAGLVEARKILVENL